MKKLVLLLSVIVLLVIATGAVSAAKPAPDTFTITGIHQRSFHRSETVCPTGACGCMYAGAAAAARLLEMTRFCAGARIGTSHLPGTCLAQDRPAALLGVIDGKPSTASSPSKSGLNRLNPVTGQSRQGKNNGVVTITAPDGTAVVTFNGKMTARTSGAISRSRRKQGTGAYADLKGERRLHRQRWTGVFRDVQWQAERLTRTFRLEPGYPGRLVTSRPGFVVP